MDEKEELQQISESNQNSGITTAAEGGELPMIVDLKEDAVVIDEGSLMGPIIIEELDESAITSMDVDMTEFVEAKAVKFQDIQDNDLSGDECNKDFSENSSNVAADETEESDRLPVDEEDRLTKQFLNGELTFSEYSLRMDRGIDSETTELETARKAFENELAASKRIGNRKYRRRRRTLPVALEGLMGEANLRFARGDVAVASQMCMEIIRQVPSAPGPFHTLAMIYENDQPEKSLQFALIAAHLSPKDADQWVRLANLSLESGNIKQAITCYSKAIQASPRDITLYRKRAKLQEQIGEKKAALKGYMRLLHNLGSEDGETIITHAKILAQRFMLDNNNEQALEAMDHLFLKCPELVTLEEVNVMTELLIALKQFHRCLDILSKYTSIEINYKEATTSNQEGGDITEEKRTIESCAIPDNVVVDLKAKLLITLIELDEIKLADDLLPKLYSEEDPEMSGDLFLDVAEALMGKKKFQKALQLLEPLVKSKNFSLAAVWLRHAECWVGCKDLKRAMSSYEIVRELSPQHLEARLELAKLYKLKGQFNKAIEVLQQDPETDVLDPGVIYQRTLLLLKVKRYNEYFQSGTLLLSRHCVSLRSKAELTTLTRANSAKHRLDALQLYRLSRGETLEDENAPSFSNENQPSLKSEFLLFLQMCRLACKQKRYGRFQRLAFSALTSKRFEKKSSHVMFLCLISCVRNNDSYYGYNMVRELVRVCRRSNSWNLMNVIIQRAEDCRHNRFIMRLLGRVDAFSYLHVLHANNCLVSGTYKYALNDYVSLFKVGPSPLLALLIAITLLQMACQKFSAKKNQLVIQAIAFMKIYSQMRGKGGEQEANYNTARAFHQLGLLPGAVHHYKLVLEETPSSLVRQAPHLLDLKREAAFNLHLIYANSESDDVARIQMNRSLASEVLFKDLYTILGKISNAVSADKYDHLEKFIKKCRILGQEIQKEHNGADTSFYPIMRLLLPQHERDRGPYGLKETALAKLYVRVLGLGKTSQDAHKLLNYKAPTSGKQTGGDFADVAYSILRERVQRRKSTMTIEQLNMILDNIAQKNANNESKDVEFQELIQQLNADEQKWLIRILLKDLRLGIPQNKILKAYHPDAADVFTVTTSLRDVCDKLKNPEIQMKYGIEIFSPFKPMLLERCKIEDVGKFFKGGESYFVQTKHDGERFQIHMQGGQFKYFSRNAYNFTEVFGESKSSGLLTPKIVKLLNPSCRSIIMDGEMMGWHKVRRRFGSKGMSFDVKKMTPTSAHQPCFVAFDIVMYNDKLLVDEPMKERLKVLRSAFEEEEGVLMKSTTKMISSQAELLDLFNKSMDTCDEGIVLKKCNSTYKPAVREGSGSYKIKAEYSTDLVEDLDLVIIGGYYGEGRFRGCVNSFLVGVMNPEIPDREDGTEFQAVSSVRTGIKIEELEDLLAKLKPYWLKTCPENVVGPKKGPPDSWVEPKNSVVLKVRATEMVRSSSYPTGYSLRFPRVVAIRQKDEKSFRECCTIKEFRSLVKDPGVIQKLTKRHVTVDDVADGPVAKSSRKVRAAKDLVANYCPSDTTDIVRISRLFDGKEICVMNGNDVISKQQAEKIVREHGGTIVQNPGRKTYCTVVGNANKVKAKNLIHSQDYTVATLDWLLRVTKPENLSYLKLWHPWELLSSSEATKKQMSLVFDNTYDSYVEDADMESLKRSLEKAGPLVTESQLTTAQYRELNKELFGDETSPYSIFKGNVGYFCTDVNQRNQEFRLMGGIATGVMDDAVTHIFDLKNGSGWATMPESLRNWSSRKNILDDQWIIDCFRERKLLPASNYLMKTN